MRESNITSLKRTILYALCAIPIACALALSACSSGPAIAKDGDTVKVLYVGTYDNGSVFDSSALHGNEPLQFTIGSGQTISGFSQAVISMTVNETKEIHIPSDDAYGPYYDSLVVIVDWSSFEEGYIPEVGEKITMQNSIGQTYQGTVINTSEEGVTVDFNHPLAGMDLNFEITLVEIVSAD